MPPGPESVLAVVDRLGSLQFDPLEIAGRNHDLVLLARDYQGWSQLCREGITVYGVTAP